MGTNQKGSMRPSTENNSIEILESDRSQILLIAESICPDKYRMIICAADYSPKIKITIEENTSNGWAYKSSIIIKEDVFLEIANLVKTSSHD